MESCRKVKINDVSISEHTRTKHITPRMYALLSSLNSVDLQMLVLK